MEQVPRQTKRVEFIDLLRGWAVVVMIQTHVFNSTLTADITVSDGFQVLKFLDGLVAPSFLFASGLAYAVTTRRKLNDYLSFGPPLFKQLGRLLLILLIGYTLHIPKFSYAHCRYVAGDRAWEVFFQADILHCIAVSLLLLQVLLLLFRDEGRMYLTVIGLTIAVIVATPVMWGIDFRNIFPVPVSAYMNGVNDSLFPLFPWSAFLFAGAVSGWFYLRARDRESAGEAGAVASMMKKLAWGSLGVFVVSFIVHPLAARTHPGYNYWGVSPSFVLLRLGLVGLLCAAMFVLEARRGVSPRSIISLVGRESLIVYVAHLTLIYGDFGVFNFNERVHGTLGYPAAIMITLGVLGATCLLALVWSRIKKGAPGIRWGVQAAFLAVLLIIFFTAPGI